jgi:iron complex transport system ATP-binding protein
MTAVVETVSLSVCIGRKALLDAISLSVAAGETVALVGPNGAGKSTLLRALAGDLAASSGAVVLRGRDPRAYPSRELALHRAVLSQSIAVAFPFTVADVVRMGAGERRGPAVEALVDDALAEVDLGDFRDRIIGTLSGGEQQRAHFARVLVQLACGEAVHGPGLLLLDEPTSNLDLRHQLDLIAATRRCAERGVTVIAILHDLNLAALLARRVVVLGSGRIAADGSPVETITEPVLRAVFGVASAVGRVPDPGLPFVLPHGARRHVMPPRFTPSG